MLLKYFIIYFIVALVLTVITLFVKIYYFKEEISIPPYLKELLSNLAKIVILTLVGLLIIELGLSLIMESKFLITTILKKNIGTFSFQELSNTFSAFFIIGAIIILLTYLINLLAGILFKKKNGFLTTKHYFIIITLGLMFFIFIIGLIFINGHFGVDNEWPIKGEGNKVLGKLICSNGEFIHLQEESLIYEGEVNCLVNSISQGAEIYAAELEYINGSLKNLDLSEEKEFILDKEIKRLRLKVGRDEDGKWNEIGETTIYPRIYDSQGDSERKGKFITYFWALLFLCIITIPKTGIEIYNFLKEEK